MMKFWIQPSNLVPMKATTEPYLALLVLNHITFVSNAMIIEVDHVLGFQELQKRFQMSGLMYELLLVYNF